MNLIFGLYIALLLVGGVMGFVKAGSKVSLISSVAFAVALAICVFAAVPNGLQVALVLQLVLIAVFVARFLKTKKFMPAGLMVVVTILAVVTELLIWPKAG